MARTAITTARGDLRIQPYSIKEATDSGVYIDLGNNFGFERTDAFAFTCRVKVGDYDPTDNRVFFAKQLNNATGYSFFLNEFSGFQKKLEVRLYGANGTSCIVRAPNEFTARNEWITLGFDYDGSSDTSGIEIYQNGVALGVASITNTLNDSMLNAQNCYIGANASGANRLDCSVTDARIHNRAIGAQAHLDIHNNRFFTSVSGEWDWSTGTGSTLTATVGGVDGTIVNGVWDANDVPRQSRTAITNPRVSVS